MEVAKKEMKARLVQRVAYIHSFFVLGCEDSLGVKDIFGMRFLRLKTIDTDWRMFSQMTHGVTSHTHDVPSEVWLSKGGEADMVVLDVEEGLGFDIVVTDETFDPAETSQVETTELSGKRPDGWDEAIRRDILDVS